MKKIIFSAIALLVCGNAFSQLLVDQKRHYFGISAGPSLPIGDFASSNKLGDAKLGLNLNLEGAVYFKPYIGIAATAGVFTNAVNIDKLNTSTTKTTADKWANGLVMLGPIGSLPLGKFTIDAKVLFGALATRKPDIESVYATGKTVTDEKLAVNFGYSAGLAVRFNIVSRLALKLNCDYISADQTFKGNEKVYQNGTSSPISYNDYTDKVSIRNINVGLGLAFQFVE